jgi:hypothetical protein
MRRRLSQFFLGTLRGRLILAVAAVHAAMMTLFIADLIKRQQEMILDRQLDEAVSLSEDLAASAAEWIASEDLAGLKEIVEAQRRYPELLFAIRSNSLSSRRKLVCWRGLTVTNGHGAPCSATHKWGILWGIEMEFVKSVSLPDQGIFS